MSERLTIDKTSVRRSFDDAADTYDAAALLQNEVCARMLSRLEYIKLEPKVVLDAGAGTGNAAMGLAGRFRDAPIVEFDLSTQMLERARKRAPWWHALPGMRRRISAVCGDLEALPLADESIGLVWSNLALQWVNDLPAVFAEMRRVLAPGGLVMFSTFGPDTLKELRAAYNGADAYTHVSRFVDLHDIGDMLVGERFADPVMDMEVMTLNYDSARAVMRDLKAIGAHNATRGRARGLTGKSALRRAEQEYEKFRRDGKLPATFEVVYGHAWKPLARVGPGGRPVIEIKSA